MNNKLIGKDLFILTNKLKRLLEKRHQEHGLYPGQARVLIYLYRNKEKYTYQKDIENAFQIRGGTVTGIIDNLVKNGYINRKASTTDKRKKMIILTDKGEEIAIKGIKTNHGMEKDLNDLLNNDERLIFTTILMKISEWIDKEEIK